ncbi:MAG: substrate-binding domain-containing protein [Acidobacteria bacterium]|nr:substrate-binding domain-containing protein [Acidobacteriota bacterium]
MRFRSLFQAIFLLLVVCHGLQGMDTLRISGTGSALGGIKLMAAAFMKKHAGVKVEVLPGIGSGGAIRAVADGKLDLACTARPLFPQEQRRDLREEGYCLTPFVFGTQPGTDVASLTLEEVERIYAGVQKTWKDGRPIRLILRPRSDAAHARLASLTPGMGAALEKAHGVPGICVGMTDGEAADHLEGTPGSFGTTTLGLIQSEGRHIRAIPINGVSPSLENLANGSYRFPAPLNFVYLQDRGPRAATAFVAFAFSPAGQRILRGAGCLPLPRATGR